MADFVKGLLYDTTTPTSGPGVSRAERVRAWKERVKQGEKPSTEEEREAKRLLGYDPFRSFPMVWDEVDRDWTVA